MRKLVFASNALAELIVTILPLLVLTAADATAAQTFDGPCVLRIYGLPGTVSDADEWRELGYTVEADQTLGDFSDRSRGKAYWAARPGTAIIFRTRESFTLLVRPNWSEAGGRRTGSPLVLNSEAVRAGYHVERPTCRTLSSLVDRARIRFAMSREAINVVNERPAPNFSWSEFILSVEDTIALREGIPVDTRLAISRARELAKKLRPTADNLEVPMMTRLQKVTREIFSFYNLRQYCKAGDSFVSSQVRRCTNCQGNTLAMITAFMDINFRFEHPYHLGVQLYADHVQPVLYDSEKHRYRILTAGGSWQTNIDAPIVRPEYVIDALLRSPVSGLTPEMIKSDLAPDDGRRWFLSDAVGSGWSAQRWLVEKLRRRPPLLTTANAKKGFGTFQFVNAPTRTNFSVDEAPEESVMAFKDFDEREESLTTEKRRMGPGTPQKAVNQNIFSDLESSVETFNADERTLVTHMLAQRVEGQLPAWFAKSPEAKEITRRFGTAGLALALGEDRVLNTRQLRAPVNVRTLAPSEVASWLPASDFAPVRLKYLAASTIERAVMLDQLLNDAWDTFKRDRQFDVITAYLGRPITADWSTNLAELNRVRAATQRLADLTTGFRQLFMATSLRPKPSIFRRPTPSYVFMTGELRELGRQAFAHANRLEIGHRRVVEVASAWPDDGIAAFRDIYLNLALTNKNITNFWEDETDLTEIWPELIKTPFKFRARIDSPLEGLLTGVLHDAQLHYTLARPSTKAQAHAPGEFVTGSALSGPAEIRATVPSVNFGIGDPCQNIPAGTYVLSNGIAVDCTAAAGESRNDAEISPALAAALLTLQSSTFLTFAPNQLAIMPLWTSHLRDAARQIGVADADFAWLKERLFTDNPFLRVSEPGRLYVLDLVDARDCVAKPGDQGADWECLSEIMRKNQPRSAAISAQSWMVSRAEAPDQLRRWLKFVKSRKDSKRSNSVEAEVKYGVGGLKEDFSDEPNKVTMVFQTMVLDGRAYLFVSNTADVEKVFDALGPKHFLFVAN